MSLHHDKILEHVEGYVKERRKEIQEKKNGM